jgi:hypothetical protein
LFTIETLPADEADKDDASEQRERVVIARSLALVISNTAFE